MLYTACGYRSNTMIAKRKFANTDIFIPELGLGTWALGGNAYGDVSEAEALRVMERAFETGMRLFDTADFYGFGVAETRLGKFLSQASHREICLLTKGGFRFMDGPVRKDFSKLYLSQALDGSLRRLGLESVDIYLLHGPRPSDLENGECLEFLREAKRAGKIRRGGVSLFNSAETSQWLDKPEVECFELPYNLLSRNLELYAPTIRQAGKGLILREIFASGFLSGQYTADFSFPKNDHRRSFPPEALQAIRQSLDKLIEEEGIAPGELLKASLAHALSLTEASVVLLGVKSAAQLEDHLRNYESL